MLANQVDVFGSSDAVPPLLLRKVRSGARDRFATPSSPSTNFFFFNVETKPFNHVDARRAVLAALDSQALTRLGSGLIEPGCYLTPTTLVGHPDEPCPRTPDLARAEQLVARSGMAGAPVTVWGPNVSPRRQWVSYVAQQLRAIGFDAREKLLTPSIYYSTVGNPKTRAQMGFVNWAASYAHPSIMWTALLSSSSPAANMGRVSDPRIDATATRLTREPVAELERSAGAWEALDRYALDQAYLASFGHQRYVKFFSDRLDFDEAVFSPLFQNDYASFELK